MEECARFFPLIESKSKPLALVLLLILKREAVELRKFKLAAQSDPIFIFSTPWEVRDSISQG